MRPNEALSIRYKAKTHGAREREAQRAPTWQGLRGGGLEAYHRVVDVRLGLKEDLDTAFVSAPRGPNERYPYIEESMSAVPPYHWGDESSEGGRLQQELAGGRRAQQDRRGRVCEARRAGGAAAQPAPTRLAGLWGLRKKAPSSM